MFALLLDAEEEVKTSMQAYSVEQQPSLERRRDSRTDSKCVPNNSKMMTRIFAPPLRPSKDVGLCGWTFTCK
jgi:hypothetical protein